MAGVVMRLADRSRLLPWLRRPCTAAHRQGQPLRPTLGWLDPLTLFVLTSGQAFIHSTGSSAMQCKYTIHRAMGAAALAMAFLGLTACSGMTRQEKNTAIGAGVGAIGGSIQTGGSTVGTVGGAAVGGVIGHEVNKK